MGIFLSSQSETFLSELMTFHELRVIREVKHDVFTANGKQEAAAYHKSINTYVFQLLRSYSIFLVNTQERSLMKSSFSVFWRKGNFILPFAVDRKRHA